MTHDTRIALFLMGELVAALRANDPDAFRGLLSEGIQELGVTEVEEFGLSLCDDDGTPIEIDLRGGSEHLSYAYLRWLFS